MVMSENEVTRLPYVHPLEWQGEELPTQFTYPFRYTPHPLCRRAALIVQEKLREMGATEGKMYGVLVVRRAHSHPSPSLFFLAAYSGQLKRSYAHPWFVPPVVDYLDPESYFQREQAKIVGITKRMEALREGKERRAWQQRVLALKTEREAAVAEAKRVYQEGKTRREALRAAEEAQPPLSAIHESQFQKGNIQRAKQLHKEEIAELEGRLAALNATVHALYEERKRRSEALQQWLFKQFVFLNGRDEQKGLMDIFGDASPSPIPSGAGECCAPKLLQTAYRLGLEPVAMAEFWWGTSKPGHYREPGAFFPACRSKCYPILTHMLEGLDVEPDPALHYDNKVLAPVRVLWEDEYLAVIAKPEGWCSIPGKSDQANLLDEAHQLWPQIEGSVIVHRLDQDTSGVMVIAKNARVHHALCQQFERREVKKRYVALLEASPQGENEVGLISLPIGPDLDNMPRQLVDYEHGKEAVTRYEVQGFKEFKGFKGFKEFKGFKGVRVVFYPQTGRTHQLRVHAAAAEGLNAPIIGDRLYGKVADRLYLHAEAITFEHPVTHAQMHFELPAPF